MTLSPPDQPMTAGPNLTKIAEDAAVAALEEATREGGYPYWRASDGWWHAEPESVGFPWNAGSRETVKPEYICVAMRGDQVIGVKFKDGLAGWREYGWSFDRNDAGGVRFIAAKIVKDETP